jgi:hypothetical protein
MAGKHKLKKKFRKNQKPDVIVGNGQAPSEGVVISGGQKSNSKKVFIIAGILTVVVVAAVIVSISHVRHQHSIANQREAIVTQGAALLNPADVQQLTPVVAQIKQQPGYATDPNALYILTVYYINLTDATNTKAYYAQLSKAYNPQKGYTNLALKKAARSPQDLKSSVTYVENQVIETQQNFVGIPGEPPKQ